MQEYASVFELSADEVNPFLAALKLDGFRVLVGVDRSSIYHLSTHPIMIGSLEQHSGKQHLYVYRNVEGNPLPEFTKNYLGQTKT